MTCPFCNSSRPSNSAPCPTCGAPAPQTGDAGAWGAGGSGGGYGASSFNSWGGPPSVNNGWNTQNTQRPLQPSQIVNDNSLWGQVMAPPPPNPGFGGSTGNMRAMGSPGMGFEPGGSGAFPASSPFQEGQQEFPGQQGPQGQSLQLVPYQSEEARLAQSLMMLSQDVSTINIGNNGAMLPALPDQEAPVYVPPMYTKPRPIIPRYRAISGLLSVLIVFTLLCAGTTYYAKATGKLTFLHFIAGDTRPANIPPAAAAKLPVPPNTAQGGPAANMITSITTTSKIDPATDLAATPINQFTVGQTVILACSTHSAKPGNVTVKWYTNGIFFKTTPDTPLAVPAGTFNLVMRMQFAQPAEGKAELYWDGQLAETVLFVVEPA